MTAAQVSVTDVLLAGATVSAAVAGSGVLPALAFAVFDAFPNPLALAATT